MELESGCRMKRLKYILAFILLVSCDSDSVSDCLQTEGSIIQQEVQVSDFNKILVNRDVELIIKEGPDYQVVIETGQNLFNDVKAAVIDNELRLTDTNTCNYFREYGITKVFVTAPNLIEIRNSSQYQVTSDGILNFDEIKLISEDANSSESFAVGDFRMQVQSQNLTVVANNISAFYISGQVENLFVGFYAGTTRFLGENLLVEHVEVFHRSSNDIIVNPQQSLTGELRGTGNLISLNEPPMVDVEQYYTGQLIFQ